MKTLFRVMVSKYKCLLRGSKSVKGNRSLNKVRASVLIHLPQPVDKTPFGIQTQAAFFTRIIEFRTNSRKKRKGKSYLGLNLGSLDFQIASFLRFMQAKVSKACIVTLALPRKVRLSRILCKPSLRCRMEAAQWRFYICQRKTAARKK